MSDKPVNFLQIGSNDGKQGDPIHDYVHTRNWKGVLVEPVPYLFERLKTNYAAKSENLHFENSAISNQKGNATFYRLKESPNKDLPFWYDQIGSFDKNQVLKHRAFIPGFDDLLVEDSVKTITFMDLISHYQLRKLDLLHIDTEGYDFEILKMVPFKEVDISIILFEHAHLSETDLKSCYKMLSANGYRVRKYGYGGDSLAIKAGLLRWLRKKKA